MKKIYLETRNKAELVNITGLISKHIEESKVKEGLCVIFCPHTTAGLTINENADPDVQRDILHYLEKLIPHDYENFHHMEGNSDGHIKASIMGSSLNIIISQGRPFLGTWQGIYFCEFDGPRKRELAIKILD
jgi:secondary thiamine-phosphate synthase enzyme